MSPLGILSRAGTAWQQLDARRQSRYRTIATTSAAVIGTAVIGSVATDTSTPWYRSLTKPAIQPPAWVFPVAWTGLYASIAAVVGRSLADLQERDQQAEHAELQKALALNLALNASWSILFFKVEQPGPATIEAGALAASSADLARRAMAVEKSRGAFLLPYVGWTTFATVLTGAIWWQNR
ncbi:tryptophan-rich sensory protein [Corynebacterium hylobatis]|uniref:Tryptophan-rich sensory protein n=1 Tax=Corynebacterium hylobatis TaxID=1859290 RepID=A0A430HZE2_9CORY|nr:TspO/MBR family protein [Corynebacterium hylobatis]RSZ63933.1 tryptophan-rich sensory protein [Corynebacterium hylobatis]